MNKKRICILSGAGMSAESGIKTFRDSGGLWENHRIEDVASPEGWKRNPQLVLDFYNQRRKQLLQSVPNEGHHIIVELEKEYDVTIITQNVDDLHERAGSSHVIHLHGELTKSRSSIDENLIFDCKQDIQLGELCPKGSQIRPHIVWFGEMVPKIEESIPFIRKADIFLIIGTSLNVYPAAGLINYTTYHTPKFLIDPNTPEIGNIPNLTIIKDFASSGMKNFKSLLSNLDYL